MVSYANALMERLVKLDSDRGDYQTVLEDVKKKGQIDQQANKQPGLNISYIGSINSIN